MSSYRDKARVIWEAAKGFPPVTPPGWAVEYALIEISLRIHPGDPGDAMCPGTVDVAELLGSKIIKLSVVDEHGEDTDFDSPELREALIDAYWKEHDEHNVLEILRQEERR